MDSPLSKLQNDLTDPNVKHRRIEPEQLRPLNQKRDALPGWGALHPTQQPQVVSEKATAPLSKKKRLDKILFASLGFFAFAIIAALLIWFFEWGAVSSDNIEITAKGQQELTTASQSFFDATVTNNNRKQLDDAKLIVLFPAGTTSKDGEDLVRVERPLGTIGAKTSVQEKVDFIPFGNTGDAVDITIRLEYSVEGSDKPFSVDVPFNARIASSPLSLGVTMPQRIAVGEEVAIGLTLTSASQQTLSDILIQADIPREFSIVSSDKPSVKGSTLWKVERLEPRERTILTMKGMVEKMPVSGSVRIAFTVGYENKKDPGSIGQRVLNEVKVLPVTDPPISITMSVPEQRISSDGAIIGNDPIPVIVSWNNTSGETISSPTISLAIEGGVLQKDLETNGQNSSSQSTVVWRETDIGSSMIPSPSSGSVTARIPTTSIESGKFVLSASIQGRKSGGSLTKLATSRREFSLNKSISLSTSVRRTAGSLMGYGPYPPLVGAETGHVVSVRIEPGRTVQGAKVRMVLPSDVKVASEIKVSVGNAYATQNEIVWDIGTISESYVSRGAGLTLDVLVSHIPSADDIGNVPILVLSTTLSESLGGIDGAIATSQSTRASATDSEARPAVRRSP